MKNYLAMFIAFIVMLVVNALGATGNINGQSQQEISDKQNVLFTPDGYVFSIWSLIYVLLIVWLVIQFMRRDDATAPSSKVMTLFILTCVFNICWLLGWHFELFGLAQVMMFLLLFTLILLYVSYPKGDLSFGGRLPFSIYLGWISVATIANMAYTLKAYDISLGIEEVIGTIILIILAFLLAVATLYARKDFIYPLVFIWAIIGIGTANTNGAIIVVAYVIAALLALITVWYLISRKRTSYSR